jgi:hypothetical protein
MALICFIKSLFKRFGDSDLAWDVDVEGHCLLYEAGLLDHVFRPDHPAYFPASGVEHLARRVNSNSLLEVGWAKVGETYVLAPIERKEEVDIVGDHPHVWVPVEDFSQLLDLLHCPELACGVVRVGDQDHFGCGCDTLLKVVKVEIPEALRIRVHGRSLYLRA